MTCIHGVPQLFQTCKEAFCFRQQNVVQTRKAIHCSIFLTLEAFLLPKTKEETNVYDHKNEVEKTFSSRDLKLQPS